MKTNSEYAAFVGLDWADRKHQICLRAAGSAHDEQSEVPNTAESLHAWAQGLRRRFPTGKIAVAVEQSRGVVIYALSKYEHLELFPLNPARTAKYREAAKAASGTKNDPLDASLQCELVRVHRDWLRPLPMLPADVRELIFLTEARRSLVDERTALSNRLTATLKDYYPQALELVGHDVSTPMAAAFLRRWPTLTAVKAARAQTLQAFYHHHHVRSDDTIAARLALVRSAVALTQDQAVLSTFPLSAAAAVTQLEALAPLIAQYDERIAACFARQPEAALYASFPGAGPQLAPRLCAAFGPNRDRYASARQLQQSSGIAPVTVQSGQTSLTHLRWRCPKFLRQTFHEIARCSIRTSVWARAYFHLQLKRGKSDQEAFRALAFKWQRIMFRCWQDHTHYDETLYLASLRKRHSPLCAEIDALEHAA
jgi:transposase